MEPSVPALSPLALLGKIEQQFEILRQAKLAEAQIKNCHDELLRAITAGETVGSKIQDELIILGCINLKTLRACEALLQQLDAITAYCISIEIKIEFMPFSKEIASVEEQMVIWRPNKPGFTTLSDRACGVRPINLGVQQGQPCAVIRVENMDWKNAQPEISTAQFGSTATTVGVAELFDLAKSERRHDMKKEDFGGAASHIILVSEKEISDWVEAHRCRVEVSRALGEAQQMLKDEYLIRGLMPPDAQ